MSAPERAGGIRALAASWRPAEIGLIALRIVVLVTVVVGVPHYPDSAAHRFYNIAHLPGIPWRDSPVEYAIGDYIVIRAVGWGSMALARTSRSPLTWLRGARSLEAGDATRRCGTCGSARHC
jgi:hypothetical protein